MWQRYRQNVEVASPVQLDVEVARRAFVDGQSRKAIALMLVAGSLHVRKIKQLQGKSKAMLYLNQTTREACSKQQVDAQIKRKEKSLTLEI
jgi:hypothetical protein